MPNYAPTLRASLLLLALCAAAPLSAQRTEPFGRLLRDLGRATAADSSDQERNVVRTVAAAPAPAPTFVWTLVPSAQGASNTQSGALQVRATNTSWIKDWAFVGSAKDRVVHSDNTNKNQLQLDLEVDPALGPDLQFLALALGASYVKRFSASTSQEYFAELDATIYENKSRAWFRQLSVGGIGYYDRLKADGSSESSSGATGGLTSAIGVRDGTSLSAEYDFNSDFNGEDYAAVTLAQRLDFGSFKPSVVLGAGKHNIYTLALKLPLP